MELDGKMLARFAIIIMLLLLGLCVFLWPTSDRYNKPLPTKIEEVKNITPSDNSNSKKYEDCVLRVYKTENGISTGSKAALICQEYQYNKAKTDAYNICINTIYKNYTITDMEKSIKYLDKLCGHSK
jgi:hypothetical protein